MALEGRAAGATSGGPDAAATAGALVVLLAALGAVAAPTVIAFEHGRCDQPSQSAARKCMPPKILEEEQLIRVPLNKWIALESCSWL